jgi:glycerophosphoryl diester phosphodiesterase
LGGHDTGDQGRQGQSKADHTVMTAQRNRSSITRLESRADVRARPTNIAASSCSTSSDRGPTLQDAWDAASPAGLLKLDLKQSDPTFLDQLVAFLSPRAGLRPVVVSSPDRAALVLLNHRLPAVTLLSSVSDPAALNRLRSDPLLVSIIAGVSAFHGLVDTNLVAWAHQTGLKVIAWTVDDGTRLVELIRQGVDGITTANLAVLRELG